MAGTFPDVPGYRFAYDVDGTAVVSYDGTGTGPISIRSLSDAARMNQNQSPSAFYYNGYISLIFPELRNILGYYISVNHDTGPGRILQSSADTTNGQDGTWMNIANPYTFILNDGGVQISPSYRSAINTVNVPGVIGVRLGMGNSLTAFHLYGTIPTANSPDRLRIVDLSNNDIVAQLDFGDIRQRNNSTKQFKVVNNSSTLTANNITVTLDTNPDASPTLIGQYQLSTDNTAYANAINIGTLAPGASSGTLYVRDTVSSTAQLGPWALRLIATANTWS